ncbi:hypothetical protein [Catalinimonas niigatensis]|uniref:hypothetical protein n=1 Tax=Catalinimonas niigatensis TaxID=1397264 RepID=UPI0026664B8A|nr:hypothetical protein [Catalinimonas niigatensis]WPP51499.1 hypothetical protein PZB72_03735 [Catalinimonas niigatensis]
MYRIINSLAVAEYNKFLGAVEINFNGQGPTALYHETMDIAMNIALIYKSNNWLFLKDDFSDISPNAFMTFVRKWSTKASEMHERSDSNYICKVALVTSSDSYLYLMSEHEWLEDSRKKFDNLHIRLFTKLEQAKKFLNNGYSSRILVET